VYWPDLLIDLPDLAPVAGAEDADLPVPPGEAHNHHDARDDTETKNRHSVPLWLRPSRMISKPMVTG
jgi:hypothetical protein